MGGGGSQENGGVKKSGKGRLLEVKKEKVREKERVEKKKERERERERKRERERWGEDRGK